MFLCTSASTIIPCRFDGGQVEESHQVSPWYVIPGDVHLPDINTGTSGVRLNHVLYGRCLFPLSHLFSGDSKSVFLYYFLQPDRHERSRPESHRRTSLPGAVTFLPQRIIRVRLSSQEVQPFASIAPSTATRELKIFLYLLLALPNTINRRKAT